MHSITSKILSGALTASFGWYLMMPPQTWRGRLDTEAPITQWYQDTAGSYDTAVECTARKNGLLTKIRENPSMPKAAEYYETYSDTLCIESNDPRLMAVPKKK